MRVDELATLDGGKCILQLRGVRPFLSDKYDVTRHPWYKYLSDADPKNAFDVERYLSTELSPKDYELYFVMEIDMEEAENDEDDSDDWYEDDTDWNGDEPLDYGAVL